MKKCHIFLFVIFLAFSLNKPICAMQGNPDKKEVPSKTSSIKSQGMRFARFTGEVALAAGISYGIIFTTTLFHELGHALALHCVNRQHPIIIFLGGLSLPKGPVKSGIYIRGFLPIGGTLRDPSVKFTTRQQVLIALAGPALGVLTAVLYDKILKNQKWLPVLTTQLCRDFNI